MMWNLIKDFWFLFGRLFPFSTKPGLRKVDNPDRNSPVLVTCNFELTVREVVKTLERAGIDAWLLVAPTKGVNVWCAAGAGHFTTDTVVSILKTTGIEDSVDHRRVILPQLAAIGVNIWNLKERTKWNPRFGPAHVKDLSAYLKSGKWRTDPEHRKVKFSSQSRFVMGTNLGFNVCLLLALPLLLASIWFPGLWWKTLPLLFVLSVLCSLLAAAGFVVASQLAWGLSPWSTLGWTAWILLVSAFVGYDMPSWSPLWRQDVKELVLGVKTTRVEIIPEKCIACHLCAVVCPTGVFGYNADTRKYEVVNLDACEACGACIENCPTAAIVNNFREGVCSCPTCYVIESVGALAGKKHRERRIPDGGATQPAIGCTTFGSGCTEKCQGDNQP